MPATCVEEKRGAGILGGMERNSDGTITRTVLRRLPSGFPTSGGGVT